MSGLIYMLQHLLDVVFYPLSWFSPFVGLFIASFVTGIVMLLLFKLTSNQQKIKAVKQQISSRFLAIRLYKDSISTISGLVADLMLLNLGYLRFAIVPLLVILVPVVLIMANLNERYGVEGLREGDSINIFLRGENAGKLDLSVSSGLEIAAGPVRASGTSEVGWRLNRTGEKDATVIIADSEMQDRIVIRDQGAVGRIAQFWGDQGLGDALVYPAGKLNLDGVTVELDYPTREVSVAGKQLHWLIIFLIVSILGGYSLKGLFKVQI